MVLRTQKGTKKLGKVSALVALAAFLFTGCSPAPTPEETPGVTREVVSYGDNFEQKAEWWLPENGDGLKTVVLIHGGYWRSGFDRSLEDAVAAKLVNEGYAVYNIDYRPAGGEWSDTFEDVAAAIDALPESKNVERLNLSQVAFVGHSAGGHLALWAGSRDQLPPGAVGAGPKVQPKLIVAQAPVTDLIQAANINAGQGAVQALLQSEPGEKPERYKQTSPYELVTKNQSKTFIIQGLQDDIVPFSQAERYEQKAQKVGADVTVQTFTGGHFEHLDPQTPAVELLVKDLKLL